MKEVKETRTIYETRDGQRFERKIAAQKHEERLNILEKYEIKGPASVPLDRERLMPLGYKWYRVNSLAEAQELMSAYGKEDAHITDDEDFPVTIGYSSIAGLFTVTQLRKEQLFQEARWKKFWEELGMEW